MSYKLRYAGLTLQSPASTEWDAVRDMTEIIRKEKPDEYRAAANGRHQYRFITINGKMYQVVGLNMNGTRLAYRKDNA